MGVRALCQGAIPALTLGEASVMCLVAMIAAQRVNLEGTPHPGAQSGEPCSRASLAISTEEEQAGSRWEP